MKPPLGDLYITSKTEMDIDCPDGVARFGNVTIDGGELILYGAVSIKIEGNLVCKNGGKMPAPLPARDVVTRLGEVSRR